MTRYLQVLFALALVASGCGSDQQPWSQVGGGKAEDSWGPKAKQRRVGPDTPLQLRVGYVMISGDDWRKARHRPPFSIRLRAGKSVGQTPSVQPQDIFETFWGAFFSDDAEALVTLPWDSSTNGYASFEYEILVGTERIAACQHTLTMNEAQTRLADLGCETSDGSPFEILFQLRSADEKQWGMQTAQRSIGAGIPLELKVVSLIIQDYVGDEEDYRDGKVQRPPLSVSVSAGKALGKTDPVPSDSILGLWGAFFRDDSPPLATLSWDPDAGTYTTFTFAIYAGAEQIASCPHALTLDEAQRRVAQGRCETVDGYAAYVGFHLRAVDDSKGID